MTPALERGRRGLSDIGGSIDRVGGQLTRLGGAMTVVGAPLALAIGGSVRAAIDFEYAFADVAKTVDATDEELAALNATIRDMATDSSNPLSALENAHGTLAEIMSLGGQLGVATENLEAFTQTIGALDVATNLNADEAATQLAQYANVAGLAAEDFDNFASALVRLGNNSATTEADIMSMTSRIASAGSRVGMADTQILSFAAALSSLGISAELGGSNFSKFVTSMATDVARGGAELDTLARVAGRSRDEFVQIFERDATSAITMFLNGLGQLNTEGQVTVLEDLGLTGMEVERVVLSLAGNVGLLGDSFDTAEEGWINASDHLTEAAAKAATTQGAMNTLKNQVTDLGIEVGNVLLPLLLQFVNDARPVIDSVMEWVQQNPELVTQIGMVAGALVILGPIVAGIGAVLSGVGAIVGVVTGAFGLLLSPVGLLIGLIAGLVFALNELYPGGLTKLFSDAAATAGMLAVIVRTVLAAAIDWVRARFQELIQTIQDVIAKVQEAVSAIQNGLGAWAGVGDNAAAIANSGASLGDIINATIGAIGAEFRAEGGPVSAGRPYIVGEQGPELFVPGTGGAIVPNGQMGGATLKIDNITIHANSESEGRAAARGFREEMDELLRARG